MKKPILSLILLTTLLITGCNKMSDPPGANPALKDYVVFAWNDLGMHCLNPDYTKAVILPPYNTVWAQVVKRGDPPSVVKEGITVEYRILNNTYSYGKRQYSSFWDNSAALFGSAVTKNKGLTGNGLSGTMTVDGDHFIVTGIPVTPVSDNGVWNPYQVCEITVKDNAGAVLISTRCTVPTSDEISCSNCHIPNVSNNFSSFQDILQKHDKLHQPPDGLLVPSAPVLCARCHGSPPLGTDGPGDAGIYASQAIHHAHASRKNPDGSAITCYSCHPGPKTLCSRSIRHSGTDGNCTTCHGDILKVASSIAGGRVPWVSEPSCVSCHTGVSEINTGTALYRNSKGHGDIYCAGCHGSPHAMYPSREATDNYQPMQYQPQANKIKSISSCGTCHNSSRGPAEGISGFAENHGGMNPKVSTGCNICHTRVNTSASAWPHAFGWKNSN